MAVKPSKTSAYVQRYVLLANRGLQSNALRLTATTQAKFTKAWSARMGLQTQARDGKLRPAMKVVHSTAETGPKLVELSDVEASALKASNAGIRLVPLVRYQLARSPRWQILKQSSDKASVVVTTGISVKVTDAASGKPVKGAQVVAFTDFASRLGQQGTTNAKGLISLKFPTTSKKLDILLIYGPAGYWGSYERGVKIKDGEVKSIAPVDLGEADYLDAVYGHHADNAGAGVRVGVIDTGIDGKHPDLQVAGGAAFVADENDAGGWGPAKLEGEHGTHVAGIIAARGHQPSGKKGVAPGVMLYSYRVFPNGGGDASNYDILRAIEQGVKDKCDLLNLSLGGDVPDEAVRDAIKEAFDQGTLCIVATGNDGRQPVSYPAAWRESVAVSAAGNQDFFPANSSEQLDFAPPVAAGSRKVFIAQFSNIGPEVDLTGPGVGIVSTLPGKLYGVMSGTSMACPAATGAAAVLLAAQAKVLKMPRDRKRATAMLAVINAAAKPLGFPKELEGLGLLS